MAAGQANKPVERETEMKKLVVMITMLVMAVMMVATVNQPETKEAFPISSDARGAKVGVILYAGISTGGKVYVESWMQGPWVTDATFNEIMVGRFTPNTIRASIFYRFDDGTVEVENALLKPYVNEMLNDWVELWEDELDQDFVEQIKAAALYWDAVWG